MEKIASFTVNHLILEPGIYVSRQDHFNDVTITTFDLRIGDEYCRNAYNRALGSYVSKK